MVGTDGLVLLCVSHAKPSETIQIRIAYFFPCTADIASPLSVGQVKPPVVLVPQRAQSQSHLRQQWHMQCSTLGFAVMTPT